MKPKIVFVVMSAIHSPESVAQLARALAPHTVVVHHDFSQTPDFSVNEPNVRFVPEPKRTGWAIWGFSEGIFHAMRYAYENLEFDYLQILSPTCLPIKPVKALEEHVASGKTDVDFAWIDMLADDDALMSVSYRGFAGEESFRHRLLRRMMVLYFNNTPERRDLAGVQLRTGGNLTLRLDDADIAPYHDNFHQQPRYIPLSQPMPLLANTPFIVTGSGKFFRNVQLDPAANLGIVKVDSDGAGYHILWGLTNEAVPTSELPAHFLSHCERIKATNGKDRVIMHCHATNLIALTYVLENDTAVFTRQLWEGSTECLVVFPDGVGILPWMVPGTDEIGQATAQEMQKHSLVLWPFHGVFGSGPTLDETFGLIDTAEKSAQVLVKVYSMGGMKQTISREELIALGKRFGVTPLASALAL